MTRADKLHKLANAIREYSGVYYAATKKWKHPPNPGAIFRIQKWLAALGLDPVKSVAAIQQFKTFDDMRKWFNTIEKTPNEYQSINP